MHSLKILYVNQNQTEHEQSMNINSTAIRTDELKFQIQLNQINSNI